MNPKMLVKRILRNSEVRSTIRLCLYSPVDAYEVIAQNKSLFIPPRGMRFNNTKTYLSLGKRALDMLMLHCDLRPDHKVLDVGCGTGCMALPLIDYLTDGIYEGFDIVPSAITWCQKHIERRNPRFRFALIEVYSKHYNSLGRLPAETLKFPYESGAFDSVMLMSVFTHMLPAGIRNYIHELSRIMKTGAKAFITTFLLNEESKAAVKNGRSVFSFPFQWGDCLVMDNVFPETAIVTPENQIMTWFYEAGLRVTTVMYGSWAGRIARENLHDDVVVQKI